MVREVHVDRNPVELGYSWHRVPGQLTGCASPADGEAGRPSASAGFGGIIS
jgi:hypothetical protein